jgi:hypothetical protein
MAIRLALNSRLEVPPSPDRKIIDKFFDQPIPFGLGRVMQTHIGHSSGRLDCE